MKGFTVFLEQLWVVQGREPRSFHESYVSGRTRKIMALSCKLKHLLLWCLANSSYSFMRAPFLLSNAADMFAAFQGFFMVKFTPPILFQDCPPWISKQVRAGIIECIVYGSQMCNRLEEVYSVYKSAGAAQVRVVTKIHTLQIFNLSAKDTRERYGFTMHYFA